MLKYTVKMVSLAELETHGKKPNVLSGGSILRPGKMRTHQFPCPLGDDG